MDGWDGRAGGQDTIQHTHTHGLSLSLSLSISNDTNTTTLAGAGLRVWLKEGGRDVGS